MPYAVFFTGGYAVHATEYTKRLGTPASHGCVRLSLENAQTFFSLGEDLRHDQHQDRHHRLS